MSAFGNTLAAVWYDVVTAFKIFCMKQNLVPQKPIPLQHMRYYEVYFTYAKSLHSVEVKQVISPAEATNPNELKKNKTK